MDTSTQKEITPQLLERLRYAFFEMGFRVGRKTCKPEDAGRYPSEKEILKYYDLVCNGRL